MVILFSILFVLIGYYFSKLIRINAVLLYISALIIAAASILFYDGSSNLIVSGSIGLSFLFVVMYTGILKKGSQVQIRLRNIRREYAIMAFILISPSVYVTVYESIFNQTPFEFIGVLAYISLIPLFITSFKLIRSKIATSTWIYIHRYAYLSYFLIFIHLMTISNLRDVVLYYLVFTIYSLFKMKDYFKKKPILKATLLTVIIGTTSIFFLSGIPRFFEKPFDIINGNTFSDGTYIGYSKGYHKEDTIVRVVIRDNVIQLVVIEECGCTPLVNNGYYYDVAYETASLVRLENSTNVDYIAGATETSNAVSKAVRDALEHAIIK